MTRKECLDKAAKCVLQNRQDQYGDVEDCFKKIARLWNAYLPSTIELEPFDVACMMALLKIARIQANPKHGDSWVDLAGYAACGADIAVPAPFCYDKPEAERGCFQNGNDHSPEASAEPDFKPGDKVQFCQFPHADVWLDGIVERVEECHCFIRRSYGVEVSAPKRLIRRPCAEGCEKPKFKAGDKVQIRVTLPSVSDRIWVDGTYARYDRGCAFPHAVYNDAGHEENVQEEDIRPAPKADEEPKFKHGDKVEVQMAPDSNTWASATIMAVYRDKDTCEWRYCVDFEDGWAHVTGPAARVRPVSMPKAEGCEELVQKDAPQTREELMQRIVDCNPSIYPRKPTGEELAEMAEEEPHG